MAVKVKRQSVGDCILCGRRLYRSERGGNLHENGERRCPTTDMACGVCDVPGLLQCSKGGCDMLVHPSCGVYCQCCQRPFCPAHASNADLLCHACGTRPGGEHGHETEETQW